ncbi:MAG: hypothetical protein Q7S31_01430 [bacterium]|nr:hypothetical protein [bacterium]
MSIEFGPSPIKALIEVQAGIQSEAERLSAKSRAYFQKHPEALVAIGAEHSDGATNLRMAGVYSQTAEQIGAVLLQHNRDLVRATNPFFSKLSDEEVDKIIQRVR